MFPGGGRRLTSFNYHSESEKRLGNKREVAGSWEYRRWPQTPNKTMTSSPQFEPNQSQARYQAAITVTPRRAGEMGKTVTSSKSIWVGEGQLKRIFAVSFMCVTNCVSLECPAWEFEGIKIMHQCSSAWLLSPRPRPDCVHRFVSRASLLSHAAPRDPVRMTIFHENYSLGILSK